MPSDIIGPRNTVCQRYTRIVGSTTIRSTDKGRLIFKSSNVGILGYGGSSFSTSLMLGYLVSVTTAGGPNNSTVHLLNVRKFSPLEEIEMDYSTLFSTVHPASSDQGKYIGLSSGVASTDPGQGAVLSMGNVGNEPGTSDARFLQINGFSTNRRKIFGFPVRNSSVIAW